MAVTLEEIALGDGEVAHGTESESLPGLATFGMAAGQDEAMLSARRDGKVRSIGRVPLRDRASLAGHATPRRRTQGRFSRGPGPGDPGGCVGRYLGTASRSGHGMSRRRGGSIHPAGRGSRRRRVGWHGVHSGMRGHAVRRRRAVRGYAPVRRRRATRGVAIERHGRRRRCRGG